MEKMDNDSERCLLGAMLLDNSIIENVYNSVKPDAFAGVKSRMVYNTILALRSKGVGADISTVYEELKGKIDASYVSELTDTVCTSANWNYYAGKVKDSYLCRSLAAVIANAKTEIENKLDIKPQDSINTMIQQLADMTKNVTGAKCYNMRELIQSEIEYLSRCMDNQQEWLGYDTGFPGLNKIINGLQSVYMVIGARPSMGKTAFAQKIALNLSKNQKVVFIELEMSPRQLTERAVSLLTQLPFRRIQSGFLTQAQMSALYNKMGELSQNQNFIPCECPTRQLGDIVNMCRSQVRNEGAKVIFIDHIGLIRCNVGAQSYDKARYISNTLQQLQRELDVPIVVLSQLGRESEARGQNAGAVNLASFRGSGAIEEDADICVFINRQRAANESDSNIPTDIVVAKNRDGAVGTVKMTFRPECVDFTDVSEEAKEDAQINREVQQAHPVIENPVPPTAEVPDQQELFGDDEEEPYDIF